MTKDSGTKKWCETQSPKDGFEQTNTRKSQESRLTVKDVDDIFDKLYDLLEQLKEIIYRMMQ